MADRTTGQLPASEIGELPPAPDIYDETRIPVEQQGEARHITGRQWVLYARSAVNSSREEAEDAAERAKQSAADAAGSAEAAAGSADEAEKSADKAEQYSGNPPIIDGEKQTWWTWNADSQTYEDTAKPSRGNLMFAAFAVDPTSGELYMYTNDEYDGPQFRLSGADLEVVLHYGD